MSVPFIYSDANGREEITVFYNNKSKTLIKGEDSRYQDIRRAVQDGVSEDEVEDILRNKVEYEQVTDDGVQVVRNQSVLYSNGKETNLSFNADGELVAGSNGVVVDVSLATELSSLYFNDLPHDGMVNFIEKLYASAISHKGSRVSEAVRTQLLNFIRTNGLTVNNEGNIIAYKAVNENYFDKHTGKTYKNLPGTVVSMPYESVDSDPNSHCSRGLHAGSLDYVATFGGGDDRIVIVVVEPDDVCSVPNDCQCRKLRCCRYTVIGNYEGELRQSVYDTVDNVDTMYEQDADIDWGEDEDDGWDYYNSGECCDGGACCEDSDEGDDDDSFDPVDIFISAIQDFVADRSESIKESNDSTPYHNKRDAKGRFTSK